MHRYENIIVCKNNYIFHSLRVVIYLVFSYNNVCNKIIFCNKFDCVLKITDIFINTLVYVYYSL